LVRTVARLGVALDHVVDHVDQEGLSDAGGGVEGQLDAQIIAAGGVRHLDHQIHSGGGRQRQPVAAAVKHGNVRLRLGRVVDPDRTLHADSCYASNLLRQQFIQGVDTFSVRCANRAHFQDLSVDQLHPVSLRQDAGVRHQVILRHVEAPPRDHRRRVLSDCHVHLLPFLAP